MDKSNSTRPISIRFGSAILTCFLIGVGIINGSKRKKFTFPITKEELAYLRSIKRK